MGSTIRIKSFVNTDGNFDKLDEEINTFLEKNNVSLVDIKCEASGLYVLIYKIL